MRLFNKKARPLPDYWNAYAKTFKEKVPPDINQLRYVVLDTETTGFDYREDRMLSIGAIALQHGIIEVAHSFEVYVQQEHYNQKTAEIHGILKRGHDKRITELEALKQLLAYMGNAVLVAHHAHFDKTMINTALKRHGLPPLMNTILDTSTLYKKTLLRSYLFEKKEQYTLDDLADKFDVSKKDRHTAMGDAYITAIAFLKILSKLREKRNLTLKWLSR